MSDEVEIPQEEAVIVETAAPPVKSGVGLPTVIICSLLAAALGAVGGAGLSGFSSSDSAPADNSKLTDQLSDVEKTQSALEAKLNRLEAAQKASQSEDSSAGNNFNDITARLEKVEKLYSDLMTLETRIISLEAGTPLEGRLIDLAGMSERIAEIEIDLYEKLDSQKGNLTETDKAGFDDLSARIQALETVPATEPVDLGPLTARVEALEVNAAETAEIGSRLIPPFPREDVIAALEAPESEEKSWLQRTLGSQISVRDEQSLATIDEITVLVAQGEVETAIKKIETLPQPAQTAAASWVTAVSN